MIDYAEVARQARNFLTWEMPSSPDIYLCWCGARSFGLFKSVGQSPYSEDRAVVKEASKAGRYWCKEHLAEHRPDVLLALLVLGGGGL